MDTILWKPVDVFWKDWEDGFLPWPYVVCKFSFPLFDGFHGVPAALSDVVSVINIEHLRNI